MFMKEKVLYNFDYMVQIFYKTHTRSNNLYWSVSHCHYFELQLLPLNVLHRVSYVVDAWILLRRNYSMLLSMGEVYRNYGKLTHAVCLIKILDY
jgi:hypothetical protein